MNGDLTGLCGEHNANDTDDIADVELLEALVFLLTEVVACNVGLNVALKIKDVAEGCLTHNAL